MGEKEREKQNYKSDKQFEKFKKDMKSEWHISYQLIIYHFSHKHTYSRIYMGHIAVSL